jgi:hypothetical protein
MLGTDHDRAGDKRWFLATNERHHRPTKKKYGGQPTDKSVSLFITIMESLHRGILALDFSQGYRVIANAVLVPTAGNFMELIHSLLEWRENAMKGEGTAAVLFSEA